MTWGSVWWFVAQAAAVLLAVLLGRRLGKARATYWKTSASLATLVMFLWPAMRFWPELALDLLGAQVVIFVELTGIIIPAALLFSIAAIHVRRRTERLAIYVLLCLCFAYFIRNGWWMIDRGVPDLGATVFAGDCCLQSTGYTCVAASAVTLLHAYDIESTETEVARLSFTQVDWGTTDTRAVYALQCKIGDRPLRVRYEAMDYPQLQRVAKPCLVSVEWGYFISHMVPVMQTTADAVTIGDPLTGERTVSVREFNDIWRGRGIYLEPVQDTAVAAGQKAPY